ncbi:hypothetical protein ACF05T_21765 [Streptomyces lateritius]|uniref:Uncharacterized protein n=1 Tax=Streptomyces lateritius TaxID=67313 RepID=A0ABW6YG13_9ACTN
MNRGDRVWSRRGGPVLAKKPAPESSRKATGISTVRAEGYRDYHSPYYEKLRAVALRP